MNTGKQTAYRQKLKGLITDVAMQCFYANGIKNVRMDDIAKKLQISKRTLYELYANKEELLLAGLKRDELAFETELQQFAEKKAHNAMEVVVKFFQMQMKRLSTINPCFFIELHKYEKYCRLLRNDSYRAQYQLCKILSGRNQRRYFSKKP